MRSTSKLEYALLLAAQGFYVFRIIPNKKKPLHHGWQKFSTRDTKIITEWWTDNLFGNELDYNIGIDCEKSGIVVIDVDCKQGKCGKDTYDELHLQYGFPDTPVAITASGGRHHIFRGAGIRNSQSILGKDIDTRGKGGFIVGPGSTVVDENAVDGGNYYWRDENAVELADLPVWIGDNLLSHQEFNTPSRAKETISEDEPLDIEAAIDFLKHHEPAIQGAGGDNHTFITVCQLKEIGIGPRTACALLEEHWNPSCSPPWSHSDLVIKVKSAYRSAQSATGSRSMTEFDGIEADYFEPLPPSGDDPPEKPKKKIKTLITYSDFDPLTIPKRQHVFGDLAYRKILTMLVAPGGEGKSTFTLTMAISAATGRDLLGIDPCGRHRVAVWNNEDDRDEQMRRVIAICQHFGIDRKELEGWLFMPANEERLRMAGRSKGVIVPEDAQMLIDQIRELKIDMVVIDPFAETHPAQENSNEEMVAVGSIYRGVAQLGNCGVVAVHHTRKLDAASSEGHSGNLDSMRGASALGGIARVVATYNTMNKKQAKAMGVEDKERGRYTVLETAKANLSAPGANFRVFERAQERINVTEDDPDGELVGVIKPASAVLQQSAPTLEDNSMLNDIQECVMDNGLSFKGVAQRLIDSKPLYVDKSLAAMVKAIRRVFGGNSEVQCVGGTLVLEETFSKGRADPKLLIKFVRADIGDFL